MQREPRTAVLPRCGGRQRAAASAAGWTYAPVFHNIVKQLTATDVLHHHEDVGGGADHLVPVPFQVRKARAGSAAVSLARPGHSLGVRPYSRMM